VDAHSHLWEESRAKVRMSLGRRVRIKTDEEVELIRLSSLLVGRTLAEVAKGIQPGVTTLELDAIAESFIRDHGAEPGFKGYGGFPNTLCTSVNDAVVHGIPNHRPLENGDVVSVDCGVLMNGFYGDSAYTFEVGEVSPEIRALLQVTKESLELAIEQAVVGKRIGDIGHAVQHHAESHGYGVVRELVGHGLGRELHEAPEVPNYGRRGNGPKLMDGMVLAIEPMINLGVKDIGQSEDGWTIVTQDGKVSAHFEHDVVVRKGKADVLSSFKDIEMILNETNEQ
jgi:methionyl aminopeptidase